jgi:hypothetical protein
MGMYGEFSVRSHDGQYLFQAILTPNEPDSSDDNRRSRCTLEVSLQYSENSDKEGTVIVKNSVDFVYGGDDRMRGDYLEELFFDEDLYEYLFSDNP